MPRTFEEEVEAEAARILAEAKASTPAHARLRMVAKDLRMDLRTTAYAMAKTRLRARAQAAESPPADHR
jgi:hypothetical protein